MAYNSVTITDANSSAALYAAVAPWMSSSGFTLVDTVVIGARTHQVHKSPAASNTANLDWYVDISYQTAGTGSFVVSAFEYYDPSTHLGYRGPVNDASSTIETTYYSRHGANGFALETNWATTSLSAGWNVNTVSTSFAEWWSVTPDRIIRMSDQAPTQLTYAGLFSPHPAHVAAAGTSLFPLVTARIPANGAQQNTINPAYCALTRLPKAASIGNGWYYTGEISPVISGRLTTLPTATSGVMDGTYISPLQVRGDMTSTTVPGSGLLGWLKDVYTAPTSSTVIRGSTVTAGSDTLTIGTSSNGNSVFFTQR